MAGDDIALDIRHLVAGQYLPLYHILGHGIEIVRLLHARRMVGRGSVGDGLSLEGEKAQEQLRSRASFVNPAEKLLACLPVRAHQT